MTRSTLLPFLALTLAATILCVPAVAAAQPVKPRFVLILDSSSSMLDNPDSKPTFGDGTTGHEGCDLNGDAIWEDSKLFQAKASVADTVAAFGSAEFAFARYRGVDLGQSCGSTADCPKDPNTQQVFDNVQCVAGACVYQADHYQCTAGCPANCKPFDRNVLYRTTACHGAQACDTGGGCRYPKCKAGQVLVPFPAEGS